MYGNYDNDEIHEADESDHLRGGPGMILFTVTAKGITLKVETAMIL